MYQEGLKHHATYRDRNLLFEVLDDPKANRRVVLQAHWTAWISPLMERMRRSEKYFAVLEPFLGPGHQADHASSALEAARREIHLLSISPGCALSGRQHQGLQLPSEHGDDRPRHRSANGRERRSADHPQKPSARVSGLSDDGPIMVGQTQDEELRRAGLDPSSIVACEMEPGDLLLWTLFTVHGSAANVSDYDRRFMINSYVRAGDSERGEWAFRDGVSTRARRRAADLQVRAAAGAAGPVLYRIRLDRGSQAGRCRQRAQALLLQRRRFERRLPSMILAMPTEASK